MEAWKYAGRGFKEKDNRNNETNLEEGKYTPRSEEEHNGTIV